MATAGCDRCDWCDIKAAFSVTFAPCSCALISGQGHRPAAAQAQPAGAQAARSRTARGMQPGTPGPAGWGSLSWASGQAAPIDA
ncbi:hypothetical protein HaLaN_12390 [Haematococcus lacustris]|uniref:Uncharacterized protein n=1 Tax=Haematococcus lacustris TaxID=44745 RepID=A0A699ZB05_HAELA|nr:hypothetical protein HaLaN_12390 [Haematococcus lacustris]